MDSIFPFHDQCYCVCVLYRDVGVCFTTDFTDTSPYLTPSIVSPTRARSTSSAGRGGGRPGLWLVCVGVFYSLYKVPTS